MILLRNLIKAIIKLYTSLLENSILSTNHLLGDSLKLVFGNVTVTIVVGDITEFSGDAIVNPANTLLIMGGGVAGALKRKGGKEIEDEARSYAPVEIGRAVVTSAGRLRCKAVIHSPTVDLLGGRSSYENVYKATRASLECAKRHGFRSIAFPLMGAGVGGLPIEKSVEAMAEAFKELGEGMDINIYVLSSDIANRVFQRLVELGFKQVE